MAEHDARALLNDDIVEYTVHRKGMRLAGTIVKILSRGQKEVTGQIIPRNGRPYLQSPDGELFEVTGKWGSAHEQWAVANITDYPNERQIGAVEISEVLGDKLLPKHDVRIAEARYNLPHEFSLESQRLAESLISAAETEYKSPHRKDHTALPFVTIDGETAKDFDDAIYVETRKDPAFVLYVAIADVSFFVERGNALDREARRRGTSVYFPGTCIPMLPERLSNDLCSLRPREKKLTLTAEIHLDRNGNIVDSRCYQAVIKTAHRLTYNQVQDFFDGKKTDFADVAKPLKTAYELYRKMLVLRKQRGSLDFNLPEGEIEVDKDGVPLRVVRAPRFDSHKLIEEFMIAANQVVAKRLREGGAGALYRVHEKPEPKTLDEINGLMRRLGIPQMVKDLSPRSLSRVLEATIRHPGAPTLHQAILRLQKQARYQEEPKGHFGLALSDYTHFTSPIRRYPDLVVHRAIKGLIGVSRHSDKEDGDSFASLGVETSEKERRAMEAERFVVRRKQCWFMLERLGQEFSGKIAGITAKGIFVEIPEFALEGFLPGDDLREEYEFDEERMCLRRRPGHSVLSLGDAIQVQLASVSVEDGEITFTQNTL